MLEMYPDQNFKMTAKQKGVSMAFLLFAIIIISLLAAALMRLNSESSISNAHQVIATRAFFAAESGAQLQAMALFPISGVGGICANQNFIFTEKGLAGCTANTTCDTTTINAKEYYWVISTGLCNAGQTLQASRIIEMRLKDIDTP